MCNSLKKYIFKSISTVVRNGGIGALVFRDMILILTLQVESSTSIQACCQGMQKDTMGTWLPNHLDQTRVIGALSKPRCMASDNNGCYATEAYMPNFGTMRLKWGHVEYGLLLQTLTSGILLMPTSQHCRKLLSWCHLRGFGGGWVRIKQQLSWKKNVKSNKSDFTET